MFDKGDSRMLLAMQKKKILNETPWWKFKARRRIKESMYRNIEQAQKISSSNR